MCTIFKKGQRIVSQYGIVCDVVEVLNDRRLHCRSVWNGRLWNWAMDTVYLVSGNGELLDWKDRTVFGKLVIGSDGTTDWELYPEEQCRILTESELAQAIE